MEGKELAEYIVNRIIKGDIFLLANDDIVEIQEKYSNNPNIKFERTNLDVNIIEYNKKSKLYFIKKDENLKRHSSDLWIPVGANWETLFGFYFEEDDNRIIIHVYYIGRKFDIDQLSEMVYNLFVKDSKKCIKDDISIII